MRNGELDWNVPAGRYRLFAFYRNATQHNLVASAFPGALQQSRVLDHLDPGGVQEYIDELGTPWLQALAPAKPDALFIDSFELIAELPWSARFRDHFRQQHGYDLTPYLPLVWRAHGESKYLNMVIESPPAFRADGDMATRIREDYESARASLFHQAFVQPLAAWMRSQGVALRLQAHGGYGEVLDDYRAADIPESEGLFGNGSFEFIKLAASAAHVGGRQRVSMESFITMSLDFNALTADDYYFLGGHAYAAGVNHTIYHGYAYHYPLPR